MILPEWMSEERPVVTKVGRNNFLIRNRHHLEALLQKFETHPLKVASVFIQQLRFYFSFSYLFQWELAEISQFCGF